VIKGGGKEWFRIISKSPEINGPIDLNTIISSRCGFGRKNPTDLVFALGSDDEGLVGEEFGARAISVVDAGEERGVVEGLFFAA